MSPDEFAALTEKLWQEVKPLYDSLHTYVRGKLNAKYGVKAMYHNYSGPGTVGSAIWDLLHVLRNFDPRWVSFHFDTGHATNAGGNNTWALNMRAAGPYVGGLSIKDSLFYLDLETPEGGPFTGTPAQLNARPPGAGPGGPGRPPAAPLSTAEQQAIDLTHGRRIHVADREGDSAAPVAAIAPGGALVGLVEFRGKDARTLVNFPTDEIASA